MLKDLNKQHIELIMDKNSQIKKLVDQLNQRLKGFYFSKLEDKGMYLSKPENKGIVFDHTRG